MADESAHQVTRLLEDAQKGKNEAIGELFGIVYDELHSIAGRKMRHENAGNILQTTALVNEAYIRLFGSGPAPLHGREHFFRAASAAMRRILIDLSRSEKAAKRGGQRKQVPLEDWMHVTGASLDRQIDLQSGLDALAELDSRAAQIVELVIYGGRSNEEIAELLGVTRRTVERDLASARLFLNRHLSTNGSHS